MRKQRGELGDLGSLPKDLHEQRPGDSRIAGDPREVQCCVECVLNKIECIDNIEE
jgi:hypothetical protein